MQDFFQNNLALLNEKSPKIGSILKNTIPENKFMISVSKSGFPTLSTIFQDGTSRSLHSKYNPLQEAINFIDTCFSTESSNYIISGLGLGYHLHELIRKSFSNARIIVIEKNPSVARLAFTYNDFSFAINHPGVSFHIGVDPEKLESILYNERTNLAINGYTLIDFKPLVDLESSYYTSIKERLIQVQQKFQIDINTQAAFSKKFYENIFDNGQSIIDSPGIIDLKNIFQGFPAILVSAGPSLDKNISLIKSARNKIVILAVATALKPLLKNGVKPDFVVAVDSNEDTFQSFDMEVIPKNLWLIYDPCVPSLVTSLFKKRRIAVDSKINLAKWLTDHSGKKGDLGNAYSVAHSAFHISEFFGCNPIILVGQDLSFDGHRMHCTGSFYNQANQDKIGTGSTLNTLEYNKYRKYSPSIKSALNIFDKHSNTTTAMETYRFQFKNEINENLQILNATEGGVNIPGAENITLREALHSYNQAHNGTNINRLKRTIKLPARNKNLQAAIIKQKDKFNQISCELKKLQNKFLANGKVSTNNKNFVLKMESVYKDLLKDTTTIHLLQGYDYLGFIEWNQRNRKIINAGEKVSANDILNQKFIRDRDFLTILIEATDFLCLNFENWMRLRN